MASFCPTVEDLCVSRGDSPVMRFSVTKRSDGSVIDISSGYSFVMTVDSSPSPENADNNAFQVTGTIYDGPNGIVQMQPSTAQTDISPGVWFYDIEMTTPVPSVRTIFKGKFTVQQDISK